jgi:hypothetical protein
VTWIEEQVEAEIPIVQALVSRVNELINLCLTSVGVVANWLIHRVIPLKRQVHPRWEYYRFHIPTSESGDNIEANKLVLLVK